MANIHGFREFQGGGPPRGYGGHDEEDHNMRNFSDVQDQLPLLGSSGEAPGDPRQESFFQMLRVACCPAFKWASFIIYITAADLIIYILMLVTGCCNPIAFLGPTVPTLKTWGAKVSQPIHPVSLRHAPPGPDLPLDHSSLPPLRLPPYSGNLSSHPAQRNWSNNRWLPARESGRSSQHNGSLLHLRSGRHPDELACRRHLISGRFLRHLRAYWWDFRVLHHELAHSGYNRADHEMLFVLRAVYNIGVHSVVHVNGRISI